MPYISKPIPGLSSNNPAIRLCCATLTTLRTQLKAQRIQKKWAMNSSLIRPSVSRKVNMLFINQIANSYALILRFIFL